MQIHSRGIPASDELKTYSMGVNMRDWKKTLAKVYEIVSGFITLAFIWTPFLWFIDFHRTAMVWHDGEPALTFEVMAMDWPDIARFVLLSAATLLAQFRFMFVGQDLADYEALKRRHEEVQAYLRQLHEETLRRGANGA